VQDDLNSAGRTIIHFSPPAAILLEGQTTRDFRFVDMPPGTILLTPMSTKIECQRKRPWEQNDVTRWGLPCAAAFACTDYKVQSRTFDRVALELRGAKTTKIKIHGEVVPSQCDLQLVCTTIALLETGRYHASIQGTGERFCR
jgi:hypothetical protein